MRQNSKRLIVRFFLALVAILFTFTQPRPALAHDQDSAPQTAPRRLLYVAAPGIRDYLEYGGHGLLVFDIDHGHRFVKRIATAGLDSKGKPLNVKGVCAHAGSSRIFISTTQQLMCLDLIGEKLSWEKRYDKGCDRMALTPDGKLIFLPSFEGPVWYVIRADDGAELGRITPDSGAHNTVAGLKGTEAYLAGLKSPLLTVVKTDSWKVSRTVGPFAASIRPFTVNGTQSLCFVNINELLGFEVGDLVSGKKLYRVEVPGFKKGPTKRHGCPSHGIGLTPDEKELWVTDSFNRRLHVFDATVMPPAYVLSIELRDEPGWVTFSIDGDLGYPSTGEVVDTHSHKIVATLKDELGREVHSEKMVEIDVRDGRPVRTGDQFGLGRVLSGAAAPVPAGAR
jgi:hypothetical protein